MSKKQYAYICAGCGAINWSNSLSCDCATPALMKFNRVTVTPAPEEIWREDAPPRRGVYRVCRQGKASTNYGYAYWTGDRWGTMCSSRNYAQEIKGAGRKTPSRYPMRWLQKGGSH